MRLALRMSVALLCGCLPPVVVEDPRAMGPERDRWEATIAATPASLFLTSMSVLADSGFSVRHADAAAGIIGTNLRRVSGRGADGDYRLDLMLLPVADSTRIIVRGELCLPVDRVVRCFPQTMHAVGWSVIRSVGEAIIARSRR